MAGQFKAGTSGSTTKIQSLSGRFVAHRLNGQLRQSTWEIRHVEIFVAVVKFSVFRNQPIRFVVGRLRSSGSIGNHVAKSGMLEEMATEGVTRNGQGFIAASNPGAAFDQVVTPVEGGRGEIIIDRLDFETFERIYRCFGPLPNVANHVEKRSV